MKSTCSAVVCQTGLVKKSTRGSVLVCVLIVLFLTGMMALQGTRLLIAFSRSAGPRVALEQCHELLELGRMRLERQLRQDPDYAGERLTIEISAGNEGHEKFSVLGEIEIVSKAASDDGPRSWRIVATAPLNQSGEMTAHWEIEE